MRLFSSRPVLRWFAPLALLLALAGTGLVAARASADDKLPSLTAEQLLIKVQQAKVDGFSGTVVQRANLGIPELPGGGSRSSQFNSLVTGSHTLRVWSAGSDKTRVALLGTLGESDLIVNGRDVWTWSSEDNAATHRRMTADETATSKRTPADAPKTPAEAAQRVLGAISPTTEVSTASDTKVAGRPAYELVLRPKDAASLISEIRMAVDGGTFVPLRVQVFGSDVAKPAAEIGFTTIDFTRPADRQFTFNPPPGAKVTQVAPKDAAVNRVKSKDAKAQAQAGSKVVGKGWSAVLVTKRGAVRDSQNAELKSLLRQLPRESGRWGSGRVLRGTVFSAVLTEDGRLAVGAVKPAALFQALGG